MGHERTHETTGNPSQTTKEKMLITGVEMWLENPMSVNAHAIAKRMKMTHAAVLYYFPDSARDAVAEYAISTGNSKIICQLIASGHKAANQLTALERAFHLASMS